ncbi:unnamed protein product, partial [marine sediment metagenome]
MKIPKLILTIILIIAFLVESTGKGYALRPMAEGSSDSILTVTSALLKEKITISQIDEKSVLDESLLRKLFSESKSFNRKWINRIIGTIKNPSSITFVAKSGDKIVGCVTGNEPGRADNERLAGLKDVHYIAGIVVKETYQHMGIGKKLFDEYIKAV